MTKRFSITTVVRCLALAASMLISFAVERDLALSHGVPETVAPAVPVAVDLFMIWAVRTGRDVALAVAVAVAANVAAVLTADPLSAVDTWVSAGLHAVFPLTIWRMHRAERPSESVADIRPTEETDRPVIAPQNGAWPDADLWQDFADSGPDAEDDSPVTPPSVEDVRAALAVLDSRYGRPVTGRMMADHFGVSERTGRRYVAMAA
ncbi:transfer protein spdA [Streptomyces mirabilis]|uniref:transfer protein spdA n=1 Tax=Streptomyces mirabilis TaxID=68239 RepID=UPI0021BE55DE|nr:transfer protein spdA [Streptomyces mirabilis]MCT9108306.1 transfer protein spdA [Streptomyces mirabilis]